MSCLSVMLFCREKKQCCQTAVVMPGRQMAAQSGILHCCYSKWCFKSSVGTLLFFPPSYREEFGFSCEDLGCVFLMVWACHWGLNGIWWNCPLNPKKKRWNFPLFSYHHRHQMNNEQRKLSQLPPFIWVNKYICTVSGVGSFISFLWDVAVALYTLSCRDIYGCGRSWDVPGGTGTSCRLKWAGENTLPFSLCTDVLASLSWLPLCQPPSNIRCLRRLSFCSYCHFDTPTSILAHTNREATWLWGLPLFAACLLNHLFPHVL